jgi:4-amino-4-deoxy-L-arabinose transferase-like glycosyltransferase
MSPEEQGGAIPHSQTQPLGDSANTERRIAGNSKGKFWSVGVALLCLGLFTIKAVTSLVQESATWDETHYFAVGKFILQNHRWDVPGAAQHPPLSYYINSIPLLLFPGDPSVWKGHGMHDALVRGQALLSSPANQGDLLLDLSRLMMVLTGVLLGWFVYVWSFSLYGEASSILAIVLYSFCPNILAHARLITPDITVATFSFLTFYYLWRFLRNESTVDAVIGGLCLGLALLSKFTGLLLVPICLGLMFLWRAKERKLNLRNCLVFAAIAAVVLCMGYGMQPRLCYAGILQQHDSAREEIRHFLMGRYSNGWWYYYIVAFVIKTPVTALLFLAMAVVLFASNIPKGRWLDEVFLLLPALAVFCFFSVNNVQIGLRYILPVYPFLFVFASRAARIFVFHKIRMGLYIAAIGWYIAASCFIHPHYLAYFNELVGGPDNGWKYLVDSNLDWGQDLKGLKRFMDEHGISRISLSYFGTDSPARYGIVYDWLPSFVLTNPTPGHHAPMLQRWVAISATCLQGTYFPNQDLFADFRKRTPAAKIGYSIFIYKLDD